MWEQPSPSPDAAASLGLTEASVLQPAFSSYVMEGDACLEEEKSEILVMFCLLS